MWHQIWLDCEMETHDLSKVNPNCLALECLTLKKVVDGVSKNIPALDKQWAESKLFTLYEPPPSPESDGSFPVGAKEEWLERMKFLLSDIEWLLGLQQFRFWSQLIFCSDSLNGVISFLQEGYPFYLLDELPLDNEIRKAYFETQKIIFTLLMRLVTHTESKWENISKPKLGEIIYNSYIVTLPLIFDVCLIYAPKNKLPVSKFITKVVNLQSQYLSDIKKSVPFIFKVLTTIEEKIGFSSQLSSGEPVKLEKREELKPEKLSLKVVADLVLHLLDSVATLDIFLECFPPGRGMCHTAGVELRLANFYENVLPIISSRIDELSSKTPSSEEIVYVRQKLDLTRFEILKTFRLAISACTDTAKIHKSEAKKLCEDYYKVLTESLAGRIFTHDYHKLYPIDLDLDLLGSLCPEIDHNRREYVMGCVRMALAETVRNASPPATTSVTPDINQPSTSGAGPSSSKAIDTPKTFTHDEISSRIAEVKDVLPHLGDGFVKACLEYYDFESSQVINAVLEESLPPHILDINPDTPWIPEEALKSPEPSTNEGELVEKQDKYRNFKECFNDKSHVRELKEVYQKFGSVDTEASLYDDEYDDTYDDVDFVPPGGDLTEEVRPFVTPRVLLEHDKSRKQKVQEEESEEDEEEKSDGPKPFDFCVNPEVLRERAAQRYQSRRRGAPRPERNVVGKPKGQGQDNDVLRNRKHKNENKSTGANHNRQALARRKRNMGMFPS